ncbi:MAG: prepilin peptidase [Minisyncoccia bacterium]|jgi:leader peptidase (prepilin peptidase)/N-methyltransferase
MLSSAILFLCGLAIGSFVNVLALRYDGGHFLFDPKAIGGRSHCPHCGRTLGWSELIPVASFFVQRGKCKHCGAPIGLHYPLVELLSGLVFVFVPLWLGENFFLSALWIAAFEALLLVAYIDIRLQIVPDELNGMLVIIAILAAIFSVGYLGPANHSFLGPYAAPFGLQNSFWASHLAGALFGGAFFGVLVLITRGKGMGVGDVKLGLALGLLFGWPDILLLYGSAFVIGALVGVALLLEKKKTMKSALPFAPFLALGAASIFFFGAAALGWYFRIIGL